MLDGHAANSGRNRYYYKNNDNVIDVEFHAISDVTGPATPLHSPQPVPYGLAVKIAMYHTIYCIENYTTPGKIIDKLA